MLNNTSNNTNSIKNNATSNVENKQLSVKAYFKNKYEHNKEPALQNYLSENQINAFMMENLPTNSLVSQQQQQQQQVPSVGAQSGLNLISNIKSNKRHFSGGSTSSLQNSEDDDDDYEEGTSQTRSREEKRRLSHTAAEQKRRNAIKHGYDELQALVPSCEFMDPSSSQKYGYQLLQKSLPSQQSQFQAENFLSTRTTRADTLEQTIDFIHQLEVDQSKHEENVDSLKKEILALKILKSNYEEILKCHRQTPNDNGVEINDETKFEIFTKVADSLFQSFNSVANPNSFGDLSASMLNWVEQCTSQNLKNVVILTLMQMMS